MRLNRLHITDVGVELTLDVASHCNFAPNSVDAFIALVTLSDNYLFQLRHFVTLRVKSSGDLMFHVCFVASQFSRICCIAKGTIVNDDGTEGVCITLEV